MGLFLTGHEVFDYISSIQEGSALLILDETGFESTMFLNGLLTDFPDKNNAVFTAAEPMSLGLKFARVELEKIPDITVLSMEMEKKRKEMKGRGVLIHGYLPHVLIREEEDRILKVIESWRERALNRRMVEVFLLRKDAFPSFEKRLQTLVAGSIFIDVTERGEGKDLSFKIIGGSKPEFHLQSFPFQVKENRLLIKWGEEFTDRLPLEGEEAINSKIMYMKENMDSLRISESSARRFDSPNPYDRWLFSQVKGSRLSDISLIFPERFDKVIRKIAVWSVKGFIKFEYEEEGEPLQPAREKLKLLSKIALLFPTGLALLFLRKRAHTIPMRVYHTLRKSVEAFISTQLPGVDIKKELSDIEMNFQEMTARQSAIETIYELGEDPRIKLDLKLMPKIISIIMFYGYGFYPKTKKIGDGEYEVSIPDCFLCEGRKGEGLICQLLAGTLIGGCSILFKEPFVCRELECKSMGADVCKFELKVDRKSTRV